MTGIKNERRIKTCAILAGVALTITLLIYNYDDNLSVRLQENVIPDSSHLEDVRTLNIITMNNDSYLQDKESIHPTAETKNQQQQNEPEKKDVTTTTSSTSQRPTEPSNKPAIAQNKEEPNNKTTKEPSKVTQVPSNTINKTSGACQHLLIEKSECEQLAIKEEVEPQRFPLQFLSGAPGSGNDWLLWLASLSKYTWPREEQQRECSYYGDMIKLNAIKLAEINTTNCLFLKNHEPWGLPLNPNEFAVRSTLLLRHPYDAAFSEYKRLILEQIVTSEDLKTSSEGLTVDRVYDIQKQHLTREFEAFIRQFFRRWLQHTDYWLNKYQNPLHILIYNTVKENTVAEVEEMQRFFGYKFDGVNFRRHCCVMADSTNPALKRQASEIDKYKGRLYQKVKSLPDVPLINSMLAKVHGWLNKKFPESHYQITRG